MTSIRKGCGTGPTIEHLLKEIVIGDNDGKLREIGWGGRSSSSKLDVPSRPRDLEVVRSGKGWVFLDWKFPTEGGEAAAYKVQCSRPEEGEWKDVGACVETQLLVNKQERGVDLQWVHGVVQNLFRLGRHHLRSANYRLLRDRSFQGWLEATGV